MAQVRTRKRGKTYSYIFEAGQVDGKRKVIEKGGFATKDEAYEAGVMAYTDWKHGNIGITSDKVTLRDFISQYMQNVVKLNVKDSTFDTYTRVVNGHIIPELGGLYLQDITPARLDKFIRVKASTGLSSSFLLQIRRLLHQALDYAVYPAELISSNPTAYMKIPKNAPKKVIKRMVISPDKYAAFAKKYPLGTTTYIPITIMYNTGMRMGEVLGLCWEDIDFTQSTVTVRRQMIYLNNVGNRLTAPKTAYSNRTIPIGANLIAILKQWKKMQSEDELSLGESYCVIDRQEDGLLSVCSKKLAVNVNRQHMICTNRNGQFVSRSWLMAVLAREGLNSHSFRHTHATQLVEAGAPLKGIAGRLGHKSISVTDEIYTHNTKKIQQDTADIFESSLQTS